MAKNIIRENYEYYYRNFTNSHVSYNLYIGGDHKVTVEFTKYEFLHMIGLGQYLKSVNTTEQNIRPDIIFNNIKNNVYKLEDFNADVCNRHFVYDKMKNFQKLQTALEIDFEIYKYHQNRFFPNEEAKYVTKSHFIDLNGKDTTILLFLEFDKNNGNYFIRSFVADPEEAKIKGLEKELKSLKILCKEKEMDGKNTRCLFCAKNFTKEEYKEKFSKQEEKEFEIAKNNSKRHKNEIKQATKELDNTRSFLAARGYVLYNRYVGDEYYICVGKRKYKVDMDNPVNIKNVAKALKKLINDDDERNKKYKKEKNNQLQIKSIGDYEKEI